MNVIDGLPPDLFNGVGVVGLLLIVASLFWRALTYIPKGLRLPRMVTGREAESYLTRAEKAEGNVEKLVATVADLTAVSKLQKATIDAALRAKRIEAAHQDEAGEVP